MGANQTKARFAAEQLSEINLFKAKSTEIEEGVACRKDKLPFALSLALEKRLVIRCFQPQRGPEIASRIDFNDTSATISPRHAAERALVACRKPKNWLARSLPDCSAKIIAWRN